MPKPVIIPPPLPDDERDKATHQHQTQNNHTRDHINHMLVEQNRHPCLVIWCRWLDSGSAVIYSRYLVSAVRYLTIFSVINMGINDNIVRYCLPQPRS